MIIPPMKKHIKAMKPLTASWSEPLKPWPLGQPSAKQAPNMATVPPIKATRPHLIRPGPNRASHMGGKACHLKVLPVFAAMNAPIKIPTTNIHCQSIFGASFMK